MNKAIILLSMLIILSPVLSAIGTVNNDSPVITPRDFDSDVGVIDGDVLYYDITDFSLSDEFTIPNVTLPNFAGNTLFVKVMYVEEDVYFDVDIDGTVIYYALGLIFEEDEIFTIGEGALATNIIIPEGAATPSIILDGVPQFNGSYGAPTQFFLNDDWVEHTAYLTAMGFTVTQNADTLLATQTDGTGELTAEWRKSDGVMTNYLIDNVDLPFVNYTGITIELQLNSKENNPLPVTSGDNIEFKFDLLDLSVTGTGDLYSSINQTEMNSIISTVESLEGKTYMKVVVNEVKGCFYLADTYIYNMETEVLELSLEPTVFNAFMGSMVIDDPPYFGAPSPATTIMSYSYQEGIAPWITPDWRIYEGQMKLYDTLYSVYFNEIIEFIDVDPDLMLFNTIGGNLELLNKRDFYFFREAVTIDIEGNEDYTETTSIIEPYVPQMAYDAGMQITAEEEGYICYDSTGVGAVIRVKADVTVLFYDTVTISGLQTGSLTISIDIKLVNPELSAPEILGNNFIPGYTWLVAIPAIFAVAAISIYRRKRA